jgi:uncharacterized protein
MILPDINVLLYAYNASSPHHIAASEWWEEALNGEELVGIPWVVVLGFLRLATNRHVYGVPFTADKACAVVEEWFTFPSIRVLHPTGTHGSALFTILRQVGTAASLTTDAHLAALALEHDCTVYSADTDFLRFAGLKVRNPLV